MSIREGDLVKVVQLSEPFVPNVGCVGMTGIVVEVLEDRHGNTLAYVVKLFPDPDGTTIFFSSELELVK